MNVDELGEKGLLLRLVIRKEVGNLIWREGSRVRYLPYLSRESSCR
jgi:hypothetical protein